MIYVSPKKNDLYANLFTPYNFIYFLANKVSISILYITDKVRYLHTFILKQEQRDKLDKIINKYVKFLTIQVQE